MVVTFKTKLDVYNTRIKCYSNGEVQIRKYKCPLTNSEKGEKKKDIIDLKYQWIYELKKELNDCPYYSTTQVQDIKNRINDLFNDIDEIKKKRENKKQLKKVLNSDTSLKTIRSDSLKRTRDIVTDFAKEHAHDWKCFVTLTFAENIADISQANKKFQTYIDQCQRYCRKHGKEFLYLGVPEFQKRGAVHYHFLCNIEPNSFLFPKQIPYKKIFNKQYKRFFTCYDCKYWSYGFSSVLDFNECDENFDPLRYMLKYLFKDLDNRLWGHKKVLRSLKLRKPQLIKTINDIPQLKELEEYLDKKCEKKEFEFIPSDGSKFQIPFDNVDYVVSSKDDYTINEFNLIVSNICQTEKYVDDVLPF